MRALLLAPEYAPDNSEKLVDTSTPERRLWCHVLIRGLSDYARVYLTAQRRPLNDREKVRFELLKYWLFIDDPIDYDILDSEVVTVYAIAEFISDDPESLVERIRKLARENPDKLITTKKKKIKNFGANALFGI